ncbi:MAG: hypothetical protein AAFY60_15165, partial [Myxococcota bacterium]
ATVSTSLVADFYDVIVERPDGSMFELVDALRVAPAQSSGEPFVPPSLDDGGCSAAGVQPLLGLLMAALSLGLFRLRLRSRLL